MTTETRERENILLVHPEEVTLVDEIGARRRREKSIARLRLLWEHRAVLLRVVLIGLVISTVVAFLIPVRYESITKLMPPDQNSGSGMLGALSALTAGGGSSSSTDGGIGSLAGVAGDVLGVRTSGDLMIGVLQSRTVQDHLIHKFNLQKVYWDRQIEDARKDLARKTDISAERKSGIITIQVTDHDPVRAAAMGREYVTELNALLTSLNTSAAHREREFLEERLKQVNQDLELSEKNLSQFSSKNATLDLKEQSVAMVDEAAALEGKLVAAQTEIEALKQAYSDNNVRVKAVQAQIDELKRQIQKLAGTSSTNKSQDQYVDSLYPTLRALPLFGVQYADLYRETKVQEATYAMLTRQYELAKVEEAKELPSVKILDEPEVPGKRSFPPRALVIFLGVLLSFSLGLGFLLGSDTWQSIDPQDPGKALAIDVWGQVKGKASRIGESSYNGENFGRH